MSVDSTTMAWAYLSLAGGFEIAWAVALKYSEHWSRFWPSVLAVLGMIASVIFLELAIRTIELGTAYAVWTGIGAVGTVLFGVWLFSESMSPAKAVCVGLIVIGIIGLNVVAKEPAPTPPSAGNAADADAGANTADAAPPK